MGIKHFQYANSTPFTDPDNISGLEYSYQTNEISNQDLLWQIRHSPQKGETKVLAAFLSKQDCIDMFQLLYSKISGRKIESRVLSFSCSPGERYYIEHNSSTIYEEL